jgi:hypothetical protein
MDEGELPGVEHLSVEPSLGFRSPALLVGLTAVPGVAEHGKADVGQVDANLVLAPGLELDLQERALREALDHAPARDPLLHTMNMYFHQFQQKRCIVKNPDF